jgi:hypothetical protein
MPPTRSCPASSRQRLSIREWTARSIQVIPERCGVSTIDGFARKGEREASMPAAFARTEGALLAARSRAVSNVGRFSTGKRQSFAADIRSEPKKLLHSCCTGQKWPIFINYISGLQVADIMVGERGFEPPAPASRRQCSTRLSYSPTDRSPLQAGARQERAYKGGSAGWQAGKVRFNVSPWPLLRFPLPRSVHPTGNGSTST